MPRGHWQTTQLTIIILSLHQMVHILQIAFSHAFSWDKMFDFLFKFRLIVYKSTFTAAEPSSQPMSTKISDIIQHNYSTLSHISVNMARGFGPTPIWFVSGYIFGIEETWEHVSVHWQQDKLQLWANCLTSRSPISNAGLRISKTPSAAHCYVQHPNHFAMTLPS